MRMKSRPGGGPPGGCWGDSPEGKVVLWLHKGDSSQKNNELKEGRSIEKHHKPIQGEETQTGASGMS